MQITGERAFQAEVRTEQRHWGYHDGLGWGQRSERDSGASSYKLWGLTVAALGFSSE